MTRFSLKFLQFVDYVLLTCGNLPGLLLNHTTSYRKLVWE